MSILRQVGTRTPQGFLYSHPPSGSLDRGMQQDVGMTKRVVSTATFTASNKRITGAANDFTSFVVDEVIVIEGSNLNNGIFTVTAIDGSNHAFLALDNGCKDEGPQAGVVVRTL